MKQYKTYKECNLDWINSIPSHWVIKSLKYAVKSKNSFRVPLSSEERGKMESKTFDYYGASGVIDKVEDYIFDEDLILIGEDGANLLTRSKKLAFIATGKYWVNNHAHILKPKNEHINYLVELLESLDYQIYVSGSAQPKLTAEALMSIKVLSPPLQEQTKIANYLNHKTEQLDTLIAKKEALINLLQEERTAMINQAVTKGLDPNVPMKDSGIGWLGEIPEHWEAKPLKYLVKNLASGVSVNSEDIPVTNELEYGILKTSCVYDFTFRPNENKQVIKLEYDRVKCPVTKSTIIISRMNTPELVGASGYVDTGYPNLFLPDRLWKTDFYDDIELNVRWLSFILVSDLYKKALSSKATGTSSSMKNISKSDFLTLPIPYSPLFEQNEITKFLLTESQRIDSIILKTEQEINLLKEYKTALISEVVTGKIDVREEVLN